MTEEAERISGQDSRREEIDRIVADVLANEEAEGEAQQEAESQYSPEELEMAHAFVRVARMASTYFAALAQAQVPPQVAVALLMQWHAILWGNMKQAG